jgi:hypothetical protein
MVLVDYIGIFLIDQNRIFSKKYYEVISGYILTNVTPKHSELSLF